jgi:VWFA-related protein
MPMNAAADRPAFRKQDVLLRIGLLVLLIGATGWSEGPGQDGAQSGQPQRVQVFFTACDKDRHPVKGLAKEEIRIFEGRAEQHVESLAVRTDVPLRLGLLIDASGSRREQFPASERAPAIGFLRSVLGPGDQAFVVAFNEQSFLLSGLTGDPALLEAAVVKATSDYRASSSLYDSVRAAAEKVLAGQNGRRVLIVVSDGLDNASRGDLAGAIRAARETQTTVHVILIAVSPQAPVTRRRAQRAGEQLAEETGGVAVFVKRADEFAAAFGALAQILGSEYVASYVPDKPPRKGEFREVRVQSTRKGVKFITKAGYYTTSHPSNTGKP